MATRFKQTCLIKSEVADDVKNRRALGDIGERKPNPTDSNGQICLLFIFIAYVLNVVWINKVYSIYAKFKLRLLNQKNTNHVEKTFWQFYARESGDSYGKAELISLEELKDESKGIYLVKDTIVLEAVMLCVSETKLILFFSVCLMCCLIMDQLVS
ncbi:unnamed protein product [Brassica rapa subsp. narinosa]